jgi:hypothetical protein
MMLARTCVMVGLLAVIACEGQKTEPTAASASAPKAETSAPAAASAASAPASASAEATPPAANPACDVNVVPGEKIGDKMVSGAAPLKVSVEAAKAYCIFGVSVMSTSTLPDIEPSAPKECKQKKAAGATQLVCESEGVTLVFGGPNGELKEVSVYPKGAAGAKPAASK